MRVPGDESVPLVAAYRLRFNVESATTQQIYATADVRYHLFLDGERIGRGPERGDPLNWYFDGYDLPLEAGAHVRQDVITSILGIRPAQWGFGAVRIAPLLGALTWAEGELPHPAGSIWVRIEKCPGHTTAKIRLPDKLTGEYLIAGKKYALHPGEQLIVSAG